MSGPPATLAWFRAWGRAGLFAFAAAAAALSFSAYRCDIDITSGRILKKEHLK